MNTLLVLRKRNQYITIQNHYGQYFCKVCAMLPTTDFLNNYHFIEKLYEYSMNLTKSKMTTHEIFLSTFDIIIVKYHENAPSIQRNVKVI